MLVAGQGLDRSRADTYEQPALTLVYHPTSEPHANDIGVGGVLGCTLAMGADWLTAHQLTEPDLGGYQVLPASARLRLACLRLLRTALQAGARADADLETLALELVEPLVRSQAAPALVPRWFHRAEEFLHDQFRAPISLRWVAREAGVHPVYLARVFRRQHGCTMSAYIRALRVVAASESLLQKGGNIAAAAHAAGFADHAHLTRSLTKLVGLTPKSLRRVRTLAAR
jgi:AraC family transcriptional regulator